MAICTFSAKTLAFEILLVRRWLRILIEASVKLSSDDTVQGGQRDKYETKKEPCPRLSSVVLVCSRLFSGNLDPGPDLPHRLDNLEEGQRDGETVDGRSHTSRGEGHLVSNVHHAIPLAPHVHN